jgi:hypothetical protein
MSRSVGSAGTHARRRTCLAAALLAVLLAVPSVANAGEGGTSHILPGANATLMDVLPTVPGWFVKPMYLHYGGDASARIPTAAGVGPVLGYIQAIGTHSLAIEVKVYKF